MRPMTKLQSTVKMFLRHSAAQMSTLAKKGRTLETYVQVLPVIRHSAEFPNGKILLCKWKAGDYKDRYTGVIRKLILSNTHFTSENLESFAGQITPVEMTPFVREMNLCGDIRFDGPPESREYIFLVTLDKHALVRCNSFSENYPYSLHWFGLNEIPYKQMPADDEIWYPHILGGRKISGFFNFGGVQEKTIKSYEVKEVENIDIELD